MMWLAIEPPQVPEWTGPAREFRLLDRAPTARQPNGVAPRKRRTPSRHWTAWALLVASMEWIPTTPREIAACWPLLKADA